MRSTRFPFPWARGRRSGSAWRRGCSGALLWCLAVACGAEDFPKPYRAPCVEREGLFEFTEKPKVTLLGNDKYEITFAVKGNCDVTVGLLDERGAVVRHLGSGVLGPNAPQPFQKGSLRQTVYWNGKDDFGAYVHEPEKMKVRVMLGLKPEFGRRLRVTNPKSIPGGAWGICCDESGVYVFYGAAAGYAMMDCRVRKFDHDGNYVRTLFPPPAHLPQEKLQGLGLVEYDAGQKAMHTPDLMSTCGGESAGCLPHALGMPTSCRPAVAGGRIYYCTLPAPEGRGPSFLHSVGTDGSLGAQGVIGRPFVNANIRQVFLAASPDGKWLYMTGTGTAASGGTRSGISVAVLFRCSLESGKPGEVLVGEVGKVGSDDGHFQAPQGLDCDAQGRIYVSDQNNNRIQIFTPDGRHAKTVALDRPGQINVHRKSGAIYVMHTTRVQGASVNRISKLTSYEDPKVECFLDGPGGHMALDSWTVKPRLWIYSGNVRILEEDGGQLQKLMDFGEEVRQEAEKAGVNPPGGWGGSTRAAAGKVVCDPLREQAYFMNSSRFDLKTGAGLGTLRLPGPIDDLAFDKRGYLHCHFNPGFYQQGVGRLDLQPDGGLRECPYDYGVEAKGWLGVLPVRDQLGAKFFQDGIGVNMWGDVAENCNIYFAPKRDDEAKSFALSGDKANQVLGRATDDDGNNYSAFLADVQRKLKTGEEVYWIRPKPGVPLVGATIWTFDRNGEVRDESAVIAGGLLNGVMIDEDGSVYFVCDRTRICAGKPFLAGQGGFFGLGKDTRVTDPLTFVQGARQREPFTGTLIKAQKCARMLSPNTHGIPLDEPPQRPPELSHDGSAWCEGAEWLYAGASPIVPFGCSCPTMRFHTDWYKRTFVPEAYRHSIGVLDAAGNLILHLGQYGNFDSGYGTESAVPVGGDGIAFSDARMVSGTDNFLCLSDRGERIFVLSLNYHTTETVPIAAK